MNKEVAVGMNMASQDLEEAGVSREDGALGAMVGNQVE